MRPGRRTPGATAAAPTPGRGSALDQRARARLRLDGVGRLRLLRRQSSRRQPVREHDPLPARRHRPAGLALPGGETRRVGPRFPRRALAHHHHEGRPAASTSWPRSRRTGGPTCSIARRGSRIFPMEEVDAPAVRRPGGEASPRGRSCPRCRLRSPASASPRTSSRGARPRRSVRCGRSGRACARRANSIRPARRARSCSRAWTAAGNGAAPPTTRATGLFYVNANEMAWTVRLKERPMPDGEPQTGKALYARYCASCHRADRRGTPPEFPSLVDISQRRSVDEIAAVVRDGAGRMPALRLPSRRGAPRARGVRGERPVGHGPAGRAHAVRRAVHARWRHPLHRPRGIPRHHPALGHA